MAIQYVMLASLWRHGLGGLEAELAAPLWLPEGRRGVGRLLPAVLGIIVYAAWDEAFNLFHHAFFRNDYWIFDPAVDPVITILPDRFFLHCALAVVVFFPGGKPAVLRAVSAFCADGSWKPRRPGG